MNIIKTGDSNPYIPIIFFEICHEDGLTRKEICKRYSKEEVTKRKSCYYLEKFIYHLGLLNIDLKDYLKKHLTEEWPTCPITGKEVGVKQASGKGLIFNIYTTAVTKEHSVKFREHCEKLSEKRKGTGNPMFGISAWNKGLTAETNEILRQNAEKNTGRIASEATREKFRNIRELSPIKARHTQKHTQETIEKLREITAKRWQDGKYNKETSIHRITRDFLKTLNLQEDFREEYQVKYYALDFAFPDLKIGIECQGTFFHIDPRFYPDGPKTSIQRRNFGRDKAKKTYLGERGWIIIELWETEINNGDFKEYLVCKLRELRVLKV